MRWYLLACVFAAAMIVIWFTTRMKMIDPPETIWKLHRMELFNGEKARAAVNDLHGSDLAPKDNFAANYVSPDGCASLYISFYEITRSLRRRWSVWRGLFNPGSFRIIPVFAGLRWKKSDCCCPGNEEISLYLYLPQRTVLV